MWFKCPTECLLWKNILGQVTRGSFVVILHYNCKEDLSLSCLRLFYAKPTANKAAIIPPLCVLLCTMLAYRIQRCDVLIQQCQHLVLLCGHQSGSATLSYCTKRGGIKALNILCKRVYWGLLYALYVYSRFTFTRERTLRMTTKQWVWLVLAF